MDNYNLVRNEETLVDYLIFRELGGHVDYFRAIRDFHDDHYGEGWFTIEDVKQNLDFMKSSEEYNPGGAYSFKIMKRTRNTVIEGIDLVEISGKRCCYVCGKLEEDCNCDRTN
jgi:hypothetical protein